MTADKEERIRKRAYEKWEKEGSQHGGHDRHWSEAESEINSEGEPKPAGRKKTADKPMMDDAGMPGDGSIQGMATDAGAKTAITGVDITPKKSSGAKRGAKKG